MKELHVVVVMLIAQLLDVIANTVSKVAMKKGMNDYVLVMYSNAFAACFLFPLTFIYYRKRTLPKLTYSIVGPLFVVGFISCSYQIFKFLGIGYTSPTLASAMADLIPAFTFILAIFFRMEKLDWKTNSTRAKSAGTVVSIAGALIITLYKGQPFINNGSSLNINMFPQKLVSSFQFDWVFGAALLIVYSFLISLMFVVQTWLIRRYPAELVVILFRCVISSVLSIPASLISAKDPKALRLGFNVQLIAIGCSAIFQLTIRSIINLWALGIKGPVFVAMFTPIEIVIAVILGIIFLGDSLYTGSVMGAVIVAIGFYGVLWGKAQEKVEEEECTVFSSESDAPLLQNKGTME